MDGLTVEPKQSISFSMTHHQRQKKTKQKTKGEAILVVNDLSRTSEHIGKESRLLCHFMNKDHDVKTSCSFIPSISLSLSLASHLSSLTFIIPSFSFPLFY
jgi:hypothetical protein